MIWEFDIALTTHDLLKRGVLAHRWTTVRVHASTFEEGRLVATQIVSCHGYVTDALLKI